MDPLRGALNAEVDTHTQQYVTRDLANRRRSSIAGTLFSCVLAVAHRNAP